ncbi:hypothetical protein DB346_12155 [Verrucomicrobia bacterium LW23]|nr:hypothetical protein DB346_12155 [Verrucomicrobia bacterium LW23]
MIYLSHGSPIVIGCPTGDNHQQTLRNTTGVRRADIADDTRAVYQEHLWLEPEGSVHRAVPLARCIVNNAPCPQAGILLNLGDRITLAPGAVYIYQGDQLEERADHVDASIPAILAESISRKTPPVFSPATLRAGQGEFIGVLGLSGMGKSTLLKLLCGQWGTETGRVLINGDDVMSIPPGTLGYVPQEDLLHHELTVRQALIYSAQLRRSRGDRREALMRLVDHTIERVGLTEQANRRVGNLSGGQRKRASIALQLIDQPKVLLLDEPSSGLDPSREAELMMLLARLTAGGCTIICTTHVLYNVHLFSQLWFVHKGGILYAGTPSDSRRRFGVDSVDKIYSLLLKNEIPPPPVDLAPSGTSAPARPAGPTRARSWMDEALGAGAAQPTAPQPPAPAGGPPGFFPPPPPPPEPEAAGRKRTAPVRRRTSAVRNFVTLLMRCTKLLFASPMTLLVLVGQALVIGFMIGVMTANPILASFLAVISALWFGCSNAAQEIVKEIDIFRREAIAGLGCATYLASKTFFWSIITSMQSLLLVVVVLCTIAAVHPKAAGETFPNQKHFPIFTLLAGEPAKPNSDPNAEPDPSAQSDAFAMRRAAAEQVAVQLVVLVAISVGAVTIGLAVSALSSSATQAQFLIPIILIPQLLGGGVVVGLAEMEPWVRHVVALMPSAAAQRLMEVTHINLLTRTNDLRHYEQQQFLNRADGDKPSEPIAPLTTDSDLPLLSNQSRVPQFLEEDPFRLPGLTVEQNPFTTTAKPSIEGFFNKDHMVLRTHPNGLAWQNITVDFDYMGQRALRWETTIDGGTIPVGVATTSSLKLIYDDPIKVEKNRKRQWVVNFSPERRQQVLSRAVYIGREDVLTRTERGGVIWGYAFTSTLIIAGWMGICLSAAYMGLRKSISAG